MLHPLKVPTRQLLPTQSLHPPQASNPLSRLKYVCGTRSYVGSGPPHCSSCPNLLSRKPECTLHTSSSWWGEGVGLDCFLAFCCLRGMMVCTHQVIETILTLEPLQSCRRQLERQRSNVLLPSTDARLCSIMLLLSTCSVLSTVVT